MLIIVASLIFLLGINFHAAIVGDVIFMTSEFIRTRSLVYDITGSLTRGNKFIKLKRLPANDL